MTTTKNSESDSIESDERTNNTQALNSTTNATVTIPVTDNNNLNRIVNKISNPPTILYANEPPKPDTTLCEYEYSDLLHCDCKLDNSEDDKDSLVGLSASEDEDDAEIRQVVNGELREIDNTSDLTSSPPPPHHSHSTCSSPITRSPVNSAHHSFLSLDSDSSDNSVPDCSNSGSIQQRQTKVSEPYPIELAIGCCRLCCPSLQDSGQNSDKNACDHQSPLIPHYPPTVSSIRNAVSHITRLDDFNVVKLSHGFFSQVFKVVHFGTKRVLVLKMNKDFSNRGNALKEIELLNKLNHENIVAFMGTVVHEGALHPLLEYINGGTLEQLIKQFYNSDDNLASQSFYCTPKLNVLSPKVHRLEDADMTFVKLMQDVAKGMSYLHNKGYIHRDLASKNIFIRKLPVDCLHNHSNNCDCCETCLAEEFDDRRLVAVIGDFGFATHEPEPDQVLSTVGSPYWLAPECLKNSWYNHKCDVYSFGIVCCELNWRIPADPDYLPRSNDFAVDFTKLNQKRDTLLGRVAQLACQTNPRERPEFEAIHTMLEISQVHFIHNEASLPDRNNNRLFNYSNKHHQTDTNPASTVGATNNGSSSILLSFEPEMRDSNKQWPCPSLVGLPQKQYQTITTSQTPIERFAMNGNHNPKFTSTIENDIFDQHLLRRHLSSFSPAPIVCSSCTPFTSSCQTLPPPPPSSPSSAGLISSASSTQLSNDDIATHKCFPDYHYSHHHHHHPYLHYHQQQIQQQEKQ